MKITLKYFASLRETLGPGDTLDWQPAAEPTAAALRTWLRSQSDAHAQALARWGLASANAGGSAVLASDADADAP